MKRTKIGKWQLGHNSQRKPVSGFKTEQKSYCQLLPSCEKCNKDMKRMLQQYKEAQNEPKTVYHLAKSVLDSEVPKPTTHAPYT